jgi:hypothetical protein
VLCHGVRSLGLGWFKPGRKLVKCAPYGCRHALSLAISGHSSTCVQGVLGHKL